MSYDIKTITKSYEKYIALLRKFFPDSAEGVDALEADLGTRLASAPRDTHPEKGGYPGGLISFALLTAKRCRMFDSTLDVKSLIRVALVHELGRLGDPPDECELFVPEESDWHREKLGRHFKYNENCPKMSVAHRSLYYIASYNLKLTTDEWISVATSAGFQYDENRFYANEVLPLAQALHMARTFALGDIKR